jgi:hypothetical protein
MTAVAVLPVRGFTALRREADCAYMNEVMK